MIARLAAAALLALTPLGAAAESPPVGQQATNFFPAQADGRAVLDAALAQARADGKLAVIVFGADWCHDSRALARVLKSDAFRIRFGARFAVTFIDVGRPQDGKGVNLDLVRRFGVKHLTNTPALFVISPKGKRINSKEDAIGWRNAESRRVSAILDWFEAISAKAG
ncbi:MAG: thioredoxin family protein [Sphingomonadaceae bacterium]